MKIVLTITRWVVGLLFIFSGLVKANDPSGLSYKMQEFFDVWGWNILDNYSLYFAVTMNLFEILAGAALIVGWRLKLFSWLLLLLIIFFTFLTSYVLFSGKIKTCGCFGDCIPLTPIQTFTKDVALLLMVLLLFFHVKKLKPLFGPGISFILLLAIVLTVFYMQVYALKHLPYVDCLPYKKGNDLLEQMKTPAGALPDQYSYTFTYKKDGKLIKFQEDKLPDNLDSTYEFIGRSEKLVKKGNGLEAKIVDFALQTLGGTDTTQAVLSEVHPYILLFSKDFSTINEWKAEFESIREAAHKKNIPVLIITADADRAVQLFNNVTLLKCDATVMKTAARVNPTYIIMQKATVLDKISYPDADKVLQYINQ